MHSIWYRPLRSAAALTFASIALAGSAFGIGFRIADQDAFGTARGQAFAATADNPSAIYYNPAGITQLEGLQSRLGVYGIRLETEVTLRNGTSFETDNDLQFVPQFYSTWKPKNWPVAFGLGTAPYGLGNKYPDDTPIRTVAKEGDIVYMTANPVVAVQLTRSLSIAAGPTINFATVALERGILARGDRFRFEGEGATAGFNAGILWQPHPKHSFGVKYHSPTRIKFDGDAEVKTDEFEVETPLGTTTIPGTDNREESSGSVSFPQFVVFGYSFRPTPDWNFEINVDWTDWDQLDTVTLRNKETGPVDVPFNYRASFMFDFGVTKSFQSGYRVSAGYMFSENSVPEEHFNPTVPDSDRHVVSFGVGRVTDRISWDITYQLAYSEDRRIEVGSIYDGDYQTISHALSISLGYHF